MVLLFIFFTGFLFSQTPANKEQPLSTYLDSLNRFIDQSVVLKNKKALDTLYAEDFAFTHGTGLFDTRASWLKTVMDTATRYISRLHDSVFVEMHTDIGIINGTLRVKAGRDDKLRVYGLRYVRVFALRGNRWQLISHRTVNEWHLQ